MIDASVRWVIHDQLTHFLVIYIRAGKLIQYLICFRTPLKSRQKPQKRHFISEDDDDDDDFRPSPSVRRKLDHSFSTTVTSRYVVRLYQSYGECLLLLDGHLAKSLMLKLILLTLTNNRQQAERSGLGK